MTVVHADRTPADHAHRDEHLALAAALPGAGLRLFYEEPGDAAPAGASAGRDDLGALELSPGLIAYLCGPLPFLRAVRGDLLRRGVPAERVHYEVFGPDLWLGRSE